jgi:nitrite reductase (NADH) large subunit
MAESDLTTSSRSPARLPGLWPTAVEQAETAAQSIVGLEREYVFVPPVTLLKVAGVDLTSCGELDGDDEIWQEDAESGRYGRSPA